MRLGVTLELRRNANIKKKMNMEEDVIGRVECGMGILKGGQK